MAANQVSLRERLQGLMLFRVILVTIFLGSTIALDAGALSSLSNPRNITLLILIVSTYVLTIIYALVLRKYRNLERLAQAQIAGDVVITAALIITTGGLESIFLFLFYLNIITAAVVIGRTGALYVAIATVGSFVLLAFVSAGMIPNPIFPDEIKIRPSKNIIYEVSINSVAAFLISVLAGYLADRLGEAAVEIEKQQFDIKELRTLNRNILTSLSSGLLTVDSLGRIIFFNHAAEVITGWPLNHVLGEPVHKIFPAIARVLGDADLSRLNTHGLLQESRFESLYKRPDNKEVFLGFSISALRNSQAEETGRIVIFQDLSDIRKLEQQMKRSERLAAIGELSAAIAHEIRNPLASISGSVEMLQTMASASEDDEMLMQIILREVERLNKLITDFLHYCSPSRLELAPANLRELIQAVLKLFENRRTEIPVQIELIDETQGPETEHAPPPILDQPAIHQVLWNLLLNAADAMNDNRDSTPRRIRVELSHDASGKGEWLVAVEDNGPGVSAEVAERIFEPFFTTKPKGTGLGLATIHRVIEEHGGRINLEAPRTLEGARFEIHLPAAPAALTGPAQDPSPAQTRAETPAETTNSPATANA